MNPENMTPEELEQFIHRELRALPSRQAPAGFETRFQAALDARRAAAALSPAQLEQLVHRELAALPPRPAPRTLEARVFAAIEQRATVPWWHKGWSYWPKGVKAGFAVAAALAAGALATGATALLGGADLETAAAAAGERFGLVLQLYHVAAWLFDFGASVFHSIPTLWLYGGLGFVAFLYVTFFGLGAAAYRSLSRAD